ncbi:MAG: P-loop NTPase [Bacillales bacterium]
MNNNTKLINNTSNIKNIIAITSGKGGVGKSFVTTLLAKTLNDKGFRVGVLDGDILGPSIAKGFNTNSLLTGENGYIFPNESKKGIKIVSSRMMLKKEEDPIIWRGPLISSLINDFYHKVIWGDLDFLLIDLPPGTSDANLTIFEELPIDGVILVTTPQDLVSKIVLKSYFMAKKFNLNILGIVNNMAYINCPHCNKKFYISNKNNLNDFIKEYNINILGEIGLNLDNTSLIDEGNAEDIKNEEFDLITKNILLKLTKGGKNDKN